MSFKREVPLTAHSSGKSAVVYTVQSPELSQAAADSIETHWAISGQRSRT